MCSLCSPARQTVLWYIDSLCVLQVEPLIEKANLGLVHHVVLFGCYDDVDREHHFNKSETGFDCYDNPNMPPDMAGCRTSIFAWGIGGGVSTEVYI